MSDPAAAPVGRGWLERERSALATDRILDAAARAFGELGVASTRIEDVAEQARCSRGTVYRYFKNRDELRLAYMHREASRLHARLRERSAGSESPGEAIVQGMVFALAEVRANPALSLWFEPEAQGTTQLLAGGSAPLVQMAVRFLDSLLEPAALQGRLRTDMDRADVAEWLMRAMLSMLGVPGPHTRTAAQEAAYLRAFVLPSVLNER